MTDTPSTATNHAYILLDRTGSMSGIWTEALGSVNAYAEALATPVAGEAAVADAKLTLAVFDHHAGFQFDILRKGVAAAGWTKVTDSDATPRGTTPLFDAVARIVALAEADAPAKAMIVIMTDGQENASREVTKDGAKAALDRVRAKGWEVIFLGADFARFADAEAVGQAAGKTMAMAPGLFEGSMRKLAAKNRRYFSAEGAPVDFDAEDRAEAGEADVQKRKGS